MADRSFYLSQDVPRLASRDQNVYIFPQTVMDTATRSIFAGLLIIILPIHIAIVQALKTTIPRVITILLTLTLFIVGSAYSGAKSSEILIAGTT